MLESFSLSPFFRGNPDLKPERSRSVEVGRRAAACQRSREGRGHLVRQPLQQHHLAARPTRRRSKAQYFNVGVTRARGLEIGTRGGAPTSGDSRARAAYTCLDSEIVESDVAEQRAFAPGNGRSGGRVTPVRSGVTFDWKRLTADLNGYVHRPVRRQRLRPVRSAADGEPGTHHLGRALDVEAHPAAQRDPGDRQPGQRRLLGAVRLSAARRVVRVGRARGVLDVVACKAARRDLVERRQGQLRRAAARSRPVRRRRDDHDVRRGGGAQPFARLRPGGPGGAGRTLGLRRVTGRCTWQTYDAAFRRRARAG